MKIASPRIVHTAFATSAESVAADAAARSAERRPAR